MGEKPLLHLETTGLRFGRSRLLENLSFDWRPGEHWGVVGPNACGKSTLVRLIAGELYDPNARVEYGFPASRGRDPEQRIATVSFEKQAETLGALDAYVQMRWNSTEEDSTPTLADWLSYESIEDIGPFEVRAGMERERAAFERRRASLLKTLDVERLLDRHVAELSNGETRRAFLVRALLARPRLLLFDAPFTGLDDHSRDIVRREMDRLARSGNVSLLVATVREENLPDCVTNVLRLGEDPAWTGTRRQTPCRRAPASTRPIIEFRNLHVAYGDNVVFEHFDWTIRKSERWLLTGPNGSGKSTLIALLNGDHLQAYANDIRLFGRLRGSGESIWDIKRRIGWVSPELHLTMDPAQTVLDTVLSGFDDSPFASGAVTPARRKAALSLLRKLGLATREDDAFGTLSGGEQRFVLLARALVKAPPLLVLDEPCQNLDAAHRNRFISLLDRMLRSSPETTLLYTTHLADAVPSCITHRRVLEGARKKI